MTEQQDQPNQGVNFRPQPGGQISAAVDIRPGRHLPSNPGRNSPRPGHGCSSTRPFAQSEAVMDDAATEVRGSLADFKKMWAVWATAWATRRKLSEIHVVGGQQFGISGGAALPAEVTAALNVLEDHLRSIDRLREDEAEMARFRAHESAVLAAQAAAMAAQPAARSRNLYR